MYVKATRLRTLTVSLTTLQSVVIICWYIISVRQMKGRSQRDSVKLFFCGPLPFISITIAPVLWMQQRFIIDPLWCLSSGCSLTVTSAGRTHTVKFKHLLDKRFSISQGGEDSCCDRLGYDPVKSCSWLTFRRNILPLSSGLKALLHVTVKNRIYRPSCK